MAVLWMALRLLRREWRSGELAVLLVSLTVAVAALTGVGFLVERIGRAVQAQASEVLAATPSVEVDGDGKVSLRGNENVAIQINGRPTPITGAQLSAYLKQIPANIVERIEFAPLRALAGAPDGHAHHRSAGAPRAA